MSEETMAILRMIQEGKVTPEQGEQLLRAVQEELAAPHPPPPPPLPPTPPVPPSHEALSEMQARLADLQSKLGEMQSRLGAAQSTSSASGGSARGFSFGLGDLNIGRVIDEAVRGISSFKVDAVRTAKQAAREAQKEARKVRHEARRTGKQFGVEFRFDWTSGGRPQNTQGLPEQTEKSTLLADLSAGTPVRVVNPYGNVKIAGGAEDGKVHVDATKTAWGDEEGKRRDLLSHFHVRLQATPAGADITVEAEGDSGEGTVDLEVSVPSATPIEVETTFGAIHCEELAAGAPKIESLSGDVTLLHLHSEEDSAGASVRTRSGDVAIHQWRGGDVHVDSASGAVKADGLRAPSASLRSRSGEVELLNVDVGVDLNIETASGDLDLRGGQCGQGLFMRSQSGDVRVSQIRAGRAQIETVSGDQRLEHIGVTNGPLTLRTVSGDAEAGQIQANAVTMNTVSGDASLAFASPFEGALAASSVSGDVVVSLWSNSSASIEMSAQNGELRCDLPLEGATGDGSKHLSGRLGEGTGSVKLQSVSGDLLIKKV